MWRLHESNKTENIEKMKTALLSMAGRVSSLDYIEVGTNISDSNSAYDIVFNGHFKDKKTLADFEADKFHLSIWRFVSGIRDKRVVVDYELLGTGV